MKMALYVAVLLALLCSSLGAPPVSPNQPKLDSENYDVDVNAWDLNGYGESYDYNVLDENEIGTIIHPSDITHVLPVTTLPPTDVPQALTLGVTFSLLKSKPTVHPTLDFKAPGLFGPDTGLGMPTCLLCVCIGGSVYCDDSDLVEVPPLPKDTTHFYARFNQITEIKAKNFFNSNQLKRIDLTGNQISSIDQDSFLSLPELQDLFLADNRIEFLPELPATMRHIDVRRNRLKSTGMHREVFKEMKDLQFLYLSDNQLNYVPVQLPESLQALHLQNNNIQSLNADTFCNSHDPSYRRKALEDIRLDGNPLNLNQYPQAYGCLPRLPVGGSR